MAKKTKQKVYLGGRKNKSVPGIGGFVGRGLGYAKSFTSVGSTANTALRIARRLADSVNVEYKERAFTVQQNPTNSCYVGTLIAPIVQGVGNGQRIGDSVKLQNLICRWTYQSAAATTIPEVCRITIYRDKENQINTGADLWAYSSSIYAPISPKQEDNKYNSVILYDKLLTLVPTAESANQCGEIKLPLNFHVKWQAGNAIVKTNDLKLCLAGQFTTANTSTINMQFEVSYTDD